MAENEQKSGKGLRGLRWPAFIVAAVVALFPYRSSRVKPEQEGDALPLPEMVEASPAAAASDDPPELEPQAVVEAPPVPAPVQLDPSKQGTTILAYEDWLRFIIDRYGHETRKLTEEYLSTLSAEGADRALLKAALTDVAYHQSLVMNSGPEMEGFDSMQEADVFIQNGAVPEGKSPEEAETAAAIIRLGSSVFREGLEDDLLKTPGVVRAGRGDFDDKVQPGNSLDDRKMAYWSVVSPKGLRAWYRSYVIDRKEEIAEMGVTALIDAGPAQSAEGEYIRSRNFDEKSLPGADGRRSFVGSAIRQAVESRRKDVKVDDYFTRVLQVSVQDVQDYVNGNDGFVKTEIERLDVGSLDPQRTLRSFSEGSVCEMGRGSIRLVLMEESVYDRFRGEQEVMPETGGQAPAR